VTVRHGMTTGRDGTWGWVEVADTGIGMTPKVQQRIFEKFYRAPEALLQGGHGVGLGLGLALVQQFVTVMQGHVEVQSTAGKGSAFRVLLPATTETEPK
jgi:signal transduction histidine kinase